MHRLLPCVLAIVACSDDPASVATTAPDSADVSDAAGTPDADAPDALDALDDLDEIDGIPTIADSDVSDTVDVDVAPPVAPVIYLTIAEIPPAMNGSQPSGELTWRYRANRAHVSLDVVATAGTLTSATITCASDGVGLVVPAAEEITPTHWRVMIDEASALPDGAAIDCAADAAGPGGPANHTSYAFDAATLPPELDPFPTTDEWLVVLTRDIFDLVVTRDPGGTASFRSNHVAGGNGVIDFDEPFYELGLFSHAHPEATALVKAHLLSKVRQNIYTIYGLDPHGAPQPGSVDIRIWFEGDGGAPAPSDYGGARRFSKIALGGDGDLADQVATFGRALIDWNNQDTEDDTVYGLGVFPTALVRQVLALDVGALVLEPYREATGGVPFGDDPDDALFLGKDLLNSDMPDGSNAVARIDIYNLFVEFGALALASIVAHELGHSLGLVPSGLPPEGLFAGEDLDFVVSVAPDAHIDTEGLNVMQTGGSVNWLEAVTGDRPRFEPFSWAYLTRQIVVGPVLDGGSL